MTVALGRSGLVALVDDEDYALVSQYRWFVRHGNNRIVYARRRLSASESPQRQRDQFMHVLIMGTVGVDHLDHNGLNNQRANLRLATAAQQAGNRRATRGASRFKGVDRDRSRRLWRAQIRQNGRTVTLGRFLSEEEAARAYDVAAVETFGEFAHLNFPLPLHSIPQDAERSAS